MKTVKKPTKQIFSIICGKYTNYDYTLKDENNFFSICMKSEINFLINFELIYFHAIPHELLRL